MSKGSSKKTKTDLPDSHRYSAPGNDKGSVAGIVASSRDITGRKQAEEALRESESILHSFFDSAGVMRGIVEVIAEDDVLHIADNAVTAAFIGLTPDAMKNRRGSELGEPRDILRMWISHYNESRKTKKPVTFEYADKRGKPEAWLHATVTYLGTPPHGHPRFAYVVLDMTESKRAEAALREGQERTSAILEGIADTFYSLDEEWRFTLVNPAAEKAPFGRPASELLGRVIWDLYPHLVGTRIHRHYLDAAEKFTLERYEAQSPLNGRWYEIFMKGRRGGVDVYMRDITGRKQTEEALRESEERFRVIAETSPVLLSVSSISDGTILFTNPAYNSAFGFQPGEIIGRPAVDRFYDAAERSASIDILRKTGELRDREVKVVRKDGTPFWVSASLARIRFGGTEAMLGASIDITDRTLAEAALRESEARYRTVADFTYDWEFWTGPDGRFIYLSPSAKKILGRPVSQYTSAEALFRDVTHPDDLFILLAHMAQEMAGQGPSTLEFRIVRPDGEVRWVQHVCQPVLDAEGRFLGTRGSNRDTTERKQAEEALLKARDELEMRVEERTADLEEAVESVSTERHRLYDVLEALPVYVCLLDKDYRMPFANRYFRETFKDPKGRRCYDFLFNRNEPCETCETYTVMKTRAPHHWFWTGPNCRDYDIYDFPFTDTDGSFMILEMGIDITEQKKAEGALKKANAYNRSLIEASLDPLVTISPDGTISDVNEATIRVTGFSRGELIGTDFSDYFTEPEKAKAGYERVFRDGSVTDYALEIRHRNGHGTPVLYNATVYRDTAGNVTGAFAAARDITERKKAQDAIERANTYNRSLIEASLDPLVTISPDGTISDVNEATIRVTGFSGDELVGTDFSDYFTEPAKAKAGYERVFRDGSVTDYALEIRHRNGNLTPVLYNATLYRDKAGNVTGAFAAARDITERKKAEEALRKEHDLLEKRVKERTSELVQSNAQLKEEISQRRLAESLVKKTISELYAAIESTADGIYAVDRTGRIIRYNQNFASMWKIPDELLQSGEDRTVSEYLRTQVKNPGLFMDSDDEHDNPKDRETYDMLELKDGRIFERYSKPQKMESSIIGRVLSYRDVTDRRHAEEKLVASLQEKETLIREIHHRVKNNLQIISGLLDMTRMRTQDSTTNSILTDMMMKIKTMAQIHTRLYESKQFDKINMGSQIRDQVADLSSIYGRSGAEILSEIDSEDIYLPVDQAIPCALVVNEILSNAFKHAFKGKKHGNLSVSATHAGDHIRIAVHDDGVGIPKDMDVYHTTSLGLKLIRSLVMQLNGSVTITSNHGTEVIVEFSLNTGGK
ncbi:MAG: PAS domain S-box protein [Methanoregula sp.]|jgi:PAS domain S-box-containing protein|uniref:PAS domain S-box protein n=1 Tax=Methanoregula sp. TaxID=2052170 RepID=UPI003C1CB693